MVGRLINVAVALLVGAISALVARYFQLQTFISLLIGLVVTAAVFVAEVLDFVKKPLELWKLRLEIAKLRREAKDAAQAQQEGNRLVRPATPEEITKYGVSYSERKLEIYIQVENDREKLEAKTFIARLREERKRHGEGKERD